MDAKGKKGKGKVGGKNKSGLNKFGEPTFILGYDKVTSPDFGPFPWATQIDERIVDEFQRTFVTGEQSKEAEEALRAADAARFAISTKAIAATGIEPAVEVLAESLATDDKKDGEEEKIEGEEYPKLKERDFFARISSSPELVIEVAKHMDPKSLLSLYCIHKHVNGIINGHLTHCMRLCSIQQAPEAARIYPFTLYESLCVRDPVGRPHPTRPDTVRMVPSLRWLQMIYHREKIVRDILACMARQGHRMPKDMNLTLKKMWLVMDIATSARRAQVMHSAYFTAKDIFNIQLFVVKLDMRFNDPIDGPGEDHLRKLMLGQRGLTPLCKLLKRTYFTDIGQIVRAAVRYDWEGKPEYKHLSIFSIPPEEIGIGHLEGWGKGRVHLYRPDELVVREAVRRRLDLKNHIMGMMLWGYVDPLTGENTPATEDEMYMSDDGSKDRPKHPLWEDYEWLEIEPKAYEESEELKESNDATYAQKKREAAQKIDDERKAREAEIFEQFKKDEEARREEETKKAEEVRKAEEEKKATDPETVEKEWRKGMSKEEERAWKERMRNSGPNTGLGSAIALSSSSAPSSWGSGRQVDE